MAPVLLSEGVSKTISTIGERLVPNLFSFVVQFLSFIVLLLVVFFFAYKPVKRILKKRADFIQGEVQEAAESKANALKDQEAAKLELANSKSQASEIIKNAEKQGQEKYEAIISEAKNEAKDIRLNAEKDIERAKQEALEDIKHEMVDVALAASKEILKREVTSKDNEELAKDFINRLN